MKKSGIASIIAIMVSLTCLLGLVGCGRTSVDDMVTNSPRVTGISSGNITSLTGLDPSFTLNSSNGKYVTTGPLPLLQQSMVRAREPSRQAKRAIYLWK